MARKKRRRRRQAAGTAPGSLTVSEDASSTAIRVMAFGPDTLVDEQFIDVARLSELRAAHLTIWVDVVGHSNLSQIEVLGQVFELHALALEDVLNVHQRPKVEPYEDHLFVVTRMLVNHETADTEQVALFLGHGWVLTFQEQPGDSFEPVRRRIRDGRPRIRGYGADYLAYALIDTIVDGYFPLVELLGDVLEQTEEDVLQNPEPETLARVHKLKRSLLELRRIAWPQRDTISALARDDSELISKRTAVFLRDCHDHAVRLMDLIETQREVASGLAELYMSSVSQRMNEVMKVLTIIATIFIPLGFLAGVYGMNFTYMPELQWRWGYPALLTLMASVGAGMLLWFWRRGWL